MTSKHKWTTQDERDVLTLGWDEFTVKYPDITAAAYRIRRNKLMRGDMKGTQGTQPTSLDRAVKNNIKMARSLIRLRHSIEADDELSDAIPRIKQALDAQLHGGVVTGLTYDELRSLVYGK